MGFIFASNILLLVFISELLWSWFYRLKTSKTRRVRNKAIIDKALSINLTAYEILDNFGCAVAYYLLYINLQIYMNACNFNVYLDMLSLEPCSV